MLTYSMPPIDTRRKPLEGQRFGKLLVLRWLGYTPRKMAVYECQCDCGTTFPVQSGNLTSGNTKACQCSWREFEDLTGQTFNNLTFVSHVGLDKKGKCHMWICRCACGKLTQPVLATSVKSGNTKSCGCIYRPSYLGIKRGKLIVIGMGPHKQGRRTVVCSCSCGNTTKPITAAAFIYGYHVSCGCGAVERAALMRTKLTPEHHKASGLRLKAFHRLYRISKGLDPDKLIDPLNKDKTAYHILQGKVQKRDNYACQLCGSKKNLNTHHIIPVSMDYSGYLEETNLITVCGWSSKEPKSRYTSCHYKIHNNGNFLIPPDHELTELCKKLVSDKYEEVF